MASGIDHIVIAVPNPDATAAVLTDALGLAFTAGGEHTGLGTFNRIAFLGDAYLELIGVRDAAEAGGWAVGRAAVATLARGGGLATYALLEEELERTASALRAAGSSIGPVVHGRRQRPDGGEVEWWSAASGERGPDQPPFLIQHAYVGPEWGPEAMTARRAFVHPIGAPLRLERLELTLPDPSALAAASATAVGMRYAVTDRARHSSAIAAVGPHFVVLVDGPVARARLQLRADGPLAERTTSVCGVDFVVRCGPQRV